MTRKDYKMIANALSHVEGFNDAVPDERGIAAATLRVVVDALAGEFQKDNPRFDYQAFKDAALPRERARWEETISKIREKEAARS